MIPIWAYAAGGSLLIGVLGGWTVRDWKADSDELAIQKKADEAYREKAQALSDQSRVYDELVQILRESERTDRETIRTIYRNVEVSPDCTPPADAVRLLDNAVDRANAARTGEPVKPVPEAAEPPNPVQ